MNNNISNALASSVIRPVSTVQSVVVNQNNETETPLPDLKKLSLSEAKQLSEEGNKLFEAEQRNLQFKVDSGTQTVVMSIIDKTTGEVVRQLPTEEALRMVEKMREFISGTGLIFQDKV